MTTSTKTTANTCKSVDFAPDLFDVKKIKHINDYTDEEIHQIWFTRQDLKQQEMEINQCVEQLLSKSNNNNNNNKLTSDDVICIRGLEHKTPDESMRRRMKILDVVCAVLDKQHCENVDELELSKFYSQLSKNCSRRAYKQGIQDSKFDKPRNSNLRRCASETYSSPPLSLSRVSNTKADIMMEVSQQGGRGRILRKSQSETNSSQLAALAVAANAYKNNDYDNKANGNKKKNKNTVQSLFQMARGGGGRGRNNNNKRNNGKVVPHVIFVE